MAAAAPASGEAAGGGSWGERSPELGLTARGGRQYGRTAGREEGGPGHCFKCGSKRGRAASDGEGDEQPRAGGCGGSWLPCEPGSRAARLTCRAGAWAEKRRRRRKADAGEGSVKSGVAGLAQSRVLRSRAVSSRDNKVAVDSPPERPRLEAAEQVGGRLPRVPRAHS